MTLKTSKKYFIDFQEPRIKKLPYQHQQIQTYRNSQITHRQQALEWWLQHNQQRKPLQVCTLVYRDTCMIVVLSSYKQYTE